MERACRELLCDPFTDSEGKGNLTEGPTTTSRHRPKVIIVLTYEFTNYGNSVSIDVKTTVFSAL